MRTLSVNSRTGSPNAARQFVRGLLKVSIPRRFLLFGGARTCGSAALTFDDGPDPAHTPAVLDALAACGAKATFFVVGQRVLARKDLTRRIVAGGHEIANHSYTHSHPDHISAAELIREVRRTADLVEEVTGVRPTFFRPPHGRLSPAKLALLLAAGHRIALWNVDTKDYEAEDDSVVAHWCARTGVCAGDVILLHDTKPVAARILPLVAAAARDAGVSLATLSTMQRARAT